MWAAIRAIPETIKNWRDNRDVLYRAVTGLAAVLVVVAVVTGKRPSESVAVVAQSVGVEPIAGWLTTNAPPLLAGTVPSVQAAALFLVLILLTGMVMVPLWRSRHEDSHTYGHEQLRLIGSPAAATIWLLLLVAAQQGDIAPALHRWGQAALVVGVSVVSILSIVGVLYFVANHYGFAEFARRILWPIAIVVLLLAVGVCLAFFAVVLAGVSLPFSIIGWMSGLESDRSRKARVEITRKRVKRASFPTGAAIVPIRAA